MALDDLRKSVLDIVNAVQRRLGVNTTAALTTTKHATLLLDLLNQLVDEVVDAGDWHELYTEVSVKCSSSVGTYNLEPPNFGIVKNIEEIRFSTQVQPMYPVTKAEIRRLQMAGSFGVPRQYSVVGVATATGNPAIRIWPIPGSNEDGSDMVAAVFIKPPLYTTADATEEPPLPAALLIQGLYCKALLEENNGEPTKEYMVEYQTFQTKLNEALNRFSADTGGSDTWFQPGAGGPR